MRSNSYRSSIIIVKSPNQAWSHTRRCSSPHAPHRTHRHGRTAPSTVTDSVAHSPASHAVTPTRPAPGRHSRLHDHLTPCHRCVERKLRYTAGVAMPARAPHGQRGVFVLADAPFTGRMSNSASPRTLAPSGASALFAVTGAKWQATQMEQIASPRALLPNRSLRRGLTRASMCRPASAHCARPPRTRLRLFVVPGAPTRETWQISSRAVRVRGKPCTAAADNHARHVPYWGGLA